jgi:hypothetical protein
MIVLDYEMSGESDDASRASETTTVASLTSNGSSEQYSRSVDALPGPFDVIFGRGRPFIDHPGNDRMRKIVEAYKARYEAAEKQDKTLITKEVVQIIKNSGEEKGRFLKQQSKGNDAPWFEVSTKEAHKKVGHRLREDKTKSVIQLIIAKRGQVVRQPNLKSIVSNDLRDSLLHTIPQFDGKRGLSYLEETTVRPVPLEEQTGWNVMFGSSIADPATRIRIPSIGHYELESRKPEQLFLPLSANFPRRYQSGIDEDEEEEKEMGESLEGDEQEGHQHAIKREPEDPLDLSLAESSQLSNEQAKYLLDRLEHLEIEGGLSIATAEVCESSADHDERAQVTDQSTLAHSLEGQYISCVPETIDDKLLDDFDSLLDDSEDFFVDEVDEVALQMIHDEQQYSSNQLPLLAPTKEPAKLLLANESEAIQQEILRSTNELQSNEDD